MTPQEKFNTAMYLLALSDDGLNTKMLENALDEINKLIYIRQNMPF